MSNFQETKRVLSRVGARLLSDEELRQVGGGFIIGRSLGSLTGPCVFDPVSCRVISGDCNNVPPACLAD
jgi:hypothetical protein